MIHIVFWTWGIYFLSICSINHVLFIELCLNIIKEDMMGGFENGKNTYEDDIILKMFTALWWKSKSFFFLFAKKHFKYVQLWSIENDLSNLYPSYKQVSTSISMGLKL